MNRVCLGFEFVILDIIYAAELVRDDPDRENDLDFIHDEEERDEVQVCPCWNKCAELIYSLKPEIVPMNAIQHDISGF